MCLRGLLAVVFALVLTGSAMAKDILITNDTGTQGKGHFLIEVNSEYGFNKDTAFGVISREASFGMESILSYGIVENADLTIAIPYLWTTVEDDDGPTAKENGISDISVEFKWRLYEKDGLSFALKPGLSLPTGDEAKGLGTGRTTYNIYFITTKVIQPWTLDLNLAYTRNVNKIEERKDIWYASLALELPVGQKTLLIGNTGIQTNTDRNSASFPAFILGGINYAVTEVFSVNVGIKGGLNDAETDYGILWGVAWRF